MNFTRTFMKKIKHAALLFLLCTLSLHAQLADFNFSIQKANETCLGNGSLTFSVSNTTANSSILYKVYLLPQVNTTLAVTADNYLGGLTAGTYKVIAVQSLGSMQNTKERTVTIDNTISPFDFTVASSNLNCAIGGTMTLTASTGSIAMCEITSGPGGLVVPAQPSNVFHNLPEGSYNIRAFNECGAGRVKSFTLTLVNAVLRISEPTYAEMGTLCDSIMVSNAITPSAGSIQYPITVRHTLSTMDISGNSVVMEKVIQNGLPNRHEVSVMMPRYTSQAYTYDMQVIDNCDVYSKDGIVVEQDLKLSLTEDDALCGEKYLKLDLSRFTPPYTVEFVSVPTTDFVASNYNATPQGPFTDGHVEYGNPNLSLPLGNYTLLVTDACGRTATESILLEFTPLRFTLRGTNNGCFSLFGWIELFIARHEIVTATITQAPPTYTGATEVTNLINNAGRLILRDMPIGDYKFSFTDNCGFNYPDRPVRISEYVDQLFNIASLPSCDPGFGTVRFRSGNGKVNLAIIKDAPQRFKDEHTLPYDVTALVNAEGDLYMDNLPEGSYVFTGTDDCGGVSGDIPVNVQGYIAPVNSVDFTAKCGGFSVKVTDNSNGLEGATYWLQRYNATTGKWVHPGVNSTAYTEGTVPTTGNAIKLTNNTVRNNLSYNGKFRVIKKFESFGNGTSQNTMCVSELGQFDYTDQFSINTIYSLACLDRPNDVMVEVTGYPTAYRIIKKDGETFIVNNGTNNIFTNLTPGEYVFQIQDACGRIEPKTVFIQTLPTSSTPTKPRDMVACVNEGEALNNVFHLTEQNPQILGPLFSSMYDITFHQTAEEAEAGTNPLPEFYPSTEDGETIHVRMQNNIIALCGGTTSFKLFRGFNQEPVITTEGTICNDGMIKLTADAGYDKYTWSTGQTSRSIFVDTPGNYTLEVFKKYGDNFGCPGSAEVTVEQSFTPVITSITTDDWTVDQNMITISAEGSNEYEYSIDDVNYQSSNVFTGLDSGRYTVYVKDAKGCGKVSTEIALLNYPKFFTPNGDGSNEIWHIKNATAEPNMLVTIFDRYGKLITAFGSAEKGWDGTLNGIQLPSTDYWFVVTREDGRELRGHFSMLR